VPPVHPARRRWRRCGTAGRQPRRGGRWAARVARVAGWGLGVAALSSPWGGAVGSVARADDLDPRLGGLRRPAVDDPAAACPTRDPTDGPDAPPRDFCADDEAWGALAGQLAFALAPGPIAPADTGGVQGFEATLLYTVTGISRDASYWQGGTASGAAVPRVLSWPRLAIRKGLPMGLRLDASGGPLLRSSTWALSGGLAWAPLEAVDTRDPGIPDLAVRGAISGYVGAEDFTLWTGSIGAVVSEPFILRRSGLELTPFLGSDLLLIRGSTGRVDLTPDVDGLAECLPAPDQPGLACTLDPNTPLPDDRQVGQDLRNEVRFQELSAARWRLALGLRVGWNAVLARVAFSLDLLAPGELAGAPVPNDAPRQWSLAIGVGGRTR